MTHPSLQKHTMLHICIATLFTATSIIHFLTQARGQCNVVAGQNNIRSAHMHGHSSFSNRTFHILSSIYPFVNANTLNWSLTNTAGIHALCELSLNAQTTTTNCHRVFSPAKKSARLCLLKHPNQFISLKYEIPLYTTSLLVR